MRLARDAHPPVLKVLQHHIHQRRGAGVGERVVLVDEFDFMDEEF